MPLTYDARWELCQVRNATLDGQPASICGARNDFATVRCQNYGVEFAWETVARIAASGGAFKS